VGEDGGHLESKIKFPPNTSDIEVSKKVRLLRCKCMKVPPPAEKCSTAVEK